MSNIVSLDNTTIVTGVTSTGQYLAVNMSEMNVGIPLVLFSSSTPDIDLLDIQIDADWKVRNETFYNTTTSYGAGLALMINNSAVCIPLYKLTQDGTIPETTFLTPTIVQNLTSTGTYAVIDVADRLYGIPIYEYGTVFPSTTYDPSSANKAISTILSMTVLDIGNNAGSTYLNPKIRAYSDLITRVKKYLGWPTITIDICDEDIVPLIDSAMELYTKYSGYTEEYLMFNILKYKPNCGIRMDAIFSCSPDMYSTCNPFGSASYDYDLKDYRKVLDVFSFEQGQGTGINTLFTIEQIVANQVYFGNLMGSNGFDLVTYDALKGWLDTREKVLAQRPLVRFNQKTQIMRIIPEPSGNDAYNAVIGCYVQMSIGDLINEPWIIQYTTALTKIAVGSIRSKYSFQMFGGLTLNGNELLQQGLTEKKELEEQLYKYTGLVENQPPMVFVG